MKIVEMFGIVEAWIQDEMNHWCSKGDEIETEGDRAFRPQSNARPSYGLDRDGGKCGFEIIFPRRPLPSRRI